MLGLWSHNPPPAAASIQQVVAYSASNGGLPSGRSRSPGFDVENKASTDASSAASVFFAGATVVTGVTPPATSSSIAPGGGGGVGAGRSGGGWSATSGLGSAEDARKDVDRAFAGSMLQRSTSAPPVSDHVRSW